jgi:DNA-binding transcriptional LysR family regulator
MRYQHIQRANLNLLVSFQVLMEERSITRAARRMFLSQPAMSRVVDRLQELLKDELFVRTAKGYEPTDRALNAYAELEAVFPKIEAVLQGSQFDPAKTRAVFKIDANDSSAIVLIPRLMKLVMRDAPEICIEVQPRTGFSRRETNDADLVLANHLELALWTGRGVEALSSEILLEDELVCLMRAGHPLSNGNLTLKRYLKAQHVAISPGSDSLRIGLSFSGEPQRLIAHVLNPLGKHRDVRLSLPYGLAIGRIVEKTDLIATIVQRIAAHLRNSKTLIVPPPAELKASLNYIQVWHPRNDSNPTHEWLRTIMRNVAAEASQS